MAPNKSKAANRKSGAGSTPSAFSQASLTQLTAQIDRDLESRNAKKLNGGKRKRGADAADNDGGDDEDDQEATAAKTQKTDKAQRKDTKKSGGADKKTMMLDEIRALGGDEDDFALVDGIDSDAEEGGAGQGSKSAADDALSLDAAFQSELAKFAAGLGFDEVRLEDEEDDEVEDVAEEAAEEEGEEEDSKEEENEEEDDDDDDEEEEDQEEQQEAAKEAPKPEAPKPAASTDPFLPKNPKFSQLVGHCPRSIIILRRKNFAKLIASHRSSSLAQTGTWPTQVHCRHRLRTTSDACLRRSTTSRRMPRR